MRDFIQCVTVPESVAKGRKSPYVQPLTKTPRRCRECHRMFPSTGPGHRLCERCESGEPQKRCDARGAGKKSTADATLSRIEPPPLPRPGGFASAGATVIPRGFEP